METKQDSAMILANCHAASCNTASRIEQRANNLRAFQKKYDAMLYLIEFMALFHQIGTRCSGHSKEMEEVRSLVIQARNELGIQSEKH